jgi:uncharacterized protein YgbK (DUF1537 family)
MTELVIIADDLTGAADTGVQFCRYFLEPILVSFQDLSPAIDTRHSQALSIYTNTRSMKPSEASGRLRLVARAVLGFHPKRIFKKVDSCLRGNIGAEVDTIMDEMGFELSFIAPAFPEMGRTTAHDIHRVHQDPIAETELARDPVTPVRESRLSRVIASQSRHRVGHIDLNLFEGAPNSMTREMTRLVDSGVRHVVFDATSQVHLDRITRLALDDHRRVLLVGSAGLASSFGSLFPEREAYGEDVVIAPEGRHHLLVVGTASQQTREQVSMLLKRQPYKAHSVPLYLLTDPKERDLLSQRISRVEGLLREGHLVLTIASRGKDEEEPRHFQSPGYAGQIVDGLGWFVASLLKTTTPASLFMSGGDTATAVLAAIGARGIRLHEEVLPGVALGTLVGTSLEGLPVVTKAGAFGREETLVALHEYWTERTRRKADDP